MTCTLGGHGAGSSEGILFHQGQEKQRASSSAESKDRSKQGESRARDGRGGSWPQAVLRLGSPSHALWTQTPLFCLKRLRSGSGLVSKSPDWMLSNPAYATCIPGVTRAGQAPTVLLEMFPSVSPPSGA